jgi:hypothetical protein
VQRPFDGDVEVLVTEALLLVEALLVALEGWCVRYIKLVYVISWSFLT